MRYFIVICSFLGLSACSLWNGASSNNAIWSVQDQRYISQQQLWRELAQADVVIIGEKHDNQEHQRIELETLKQLADRRVQASVVLEMLNQDQQVLLDQVKQNPVDNEQLAQALNWSTGWDWQQYGTLVEYLIEQDSALLAANFNREQIKALYHNAPNLTGSASTASSVQQKLTEQVRLSHCNKLPESQLAPMVAIQQNRDRLMATKLAHADKPSALITGAFHARKDMGVPLHLQDLHVHNAKVLLLLEDKQVVPSNSADYIWYTTPAPEQDYCAQLN